jgi:HD superfamily phosphodiesterase
MFTKTGKELAQDRHEVIERFLKEFLEEWDGGR